MGDDTRSVMLDLGTGRFRMGFAGDDVPDIREYSMCGTPVNGVELEKGCFIGNDAQERRDLLDLKYIKKHGTIENYDLFEKLVSRMYDLKKIKAEECPLLLSQEVFTKSTQAERLAQLLFETYNVPAMYIQIGAILATYAAGRTTGLTLNIGEGVTSTVPIYEGYALRKGIVRQNFAGGEITKYLASLLAERDYFFETPSELELVREIKEKVGEVSQKFLYDVHHTEEIEYELPDGEKLKVGAERFQCNEALFHPSLASDAELIGVHEMVSKSVENSPVDTRKDMKGNIVLVGGTTLTKAFPERVTTELKNSTPNNSNRWKVVAAPDREDTVWIGGSILASLSTFQSMWFALDEYDESGPGFVHVKCRNV